MRKYHFEIKFTIDAESEEEAIELSQTISIDDMDLTAELIHSTEV